VICWPAAVEPAMGAALLAACLQEEDEDAGPPWERRS
jgi:hypothetical protein